MLQCTSCYVLLIALGLDHRAGFAAAAGVLFAVNVTAVLPAAPSNIGVFQAACVAVLHGAFHVSTADAIAYGIVLQAVEVTTAVAMGIPALLREGISWRDVKLRAMHAAPVTLRRRARARRSRASTLARRPRPSDRRSRAGGVLTAACPHAWVYILRCGDGSLYTGWTVDLERRLARHRAGTASRYTRSRLPVELLASFAMADAARRAARRRASKRSHAPRSSRWRAIREARNASSPAQSVGADGPERTRDP